ncbi:alpha/beta hydrolase [Streptomyces sp. SID13031]|uniref:alpha/beta fold hydrolase n=1 Tax=Streptomyces sp. SID13031 TaxID=2706046 RepID=UPI0013CC54D7|nr:alpha/beta hydrolase [Streptomyces sp. SID13031]NEA36418.1 alpha/beta hydrolase [Streptomyces sp. SID13031]
MNEVALSAGTIEYDDLGAGSPIVLLHGLLMDSTLWDGPVAELASNHRCVVPTLPLGAHRRAMNADADLSLPGVARLVEEFLERLGLEDVTLVGNDTGGALVQLLIDSPRIGRIVLVSCEAFDNLPPGLTGRTLAVVGKLSPGLLGVFLQQLRLKAVRRLPITFGWLTKRGDAATARWVRPLLRQPEIRRDVVRVLRAAFADRRLLVKAAERLPLFDRPALVVWAGEDRVMPVEHGRRLAELLPRGRYVEVGDSYTLVPLDQPALLGQLIKEFAKG